MNLHPLNALSAALSARQWGLGDGHVAHCAGVGDGPAKLSSGSCCSINRIMAVSMLPQHADNGSRLGIYCSVTLKTELVYVRRFKTLQDARMEIYEYLEGFYNRQESAFPLWAISAL